MREDWTKDDDDKRLYGGDTFGTPGIRPKSRSCPLNGRILSRDIEWRGTKAYCPRYGTELEFEGS